MTHPCICKILVIDEFGGAVLDLTPKELSEKGFDLGDTVDIAFSNGVRIENVPYFNGFYVKIHEPILVAYPGFEHPSVNYNCLNLQDRTGISPSDTVTITMHEKAGQKSVMDLRGVVYSVDPKDYRSGDQFANAREFRAGKIAPRKLYRCASPFDHMMNRPEAVDAFLEKNHVRTTFSISETEETLRRRYEEMPPYARKIYEAGHVLPLGLGAGYYSEEFRAGLTRWLIRALDEPLPWAIHCLEGKDRTGFVCALLGALMGGTYRELADDYMLTYDNYYGITQETDPVRYQGFKSTFIDTYLRTFAGLGENEDPEGHDYREGAADYLRAGGMTEEQINRLIKLLSEE